MSLVRVLVVVSFARLAVTVGFGHADAAVLASGAPWAAADVLQPAAFRT